MTRGVIALAVTVEIDEELSDDVSHVGRPIPSAQRMKRRALTSVFRMVPSQGRPHLSRSTAADLM